jgi:hypothetical protein
MTREAGEKLGTYAINTTKTVPFQYYFTSNMVTVVTPGTLTIKPNPADFSQDGNEYTIHTVTGWDNFCDLLENNDNGYFDGKTVKLMQTSPSAAWLEAKGMNSQARSTATRIR